MRSTARLLQLLTTLCVAVCVNSDYIHLTMLDADLVSLDTAKTARVAQRSLVKRASLDDQSRPSDVEETLNLLRREKLAANMYYASWHNDLEAAAADLVKSCKIRTNPRVLGPNSRTYNYEGIAGYLRKTHEVSDQLRSAYNKTEFRRQLQKPNMRAVGCAVGKDDCTFFDDRQQQVVIVHRFACIFGYKRSSSSEVKPGAACTRCETDAVWCDDGLCRVGCKSGGQNCHRCASLCNDHVYDYNCKSATAADRCQCICYYDDDTSRCGGETSASGSTCHHSHTIPIGWAVFLVFVGAAVLIVVVVVVIQCCVRLHRRLASRRVRPRGCRPQTSTATEYEPGPNFVPTMSPPPYDSDKPPDYATVTNNDPGKTSAVGSAAADDSLPAYDNDVSLADEVKEC